MNDHTPGPWKLSTDSLFQEFVIVGASTLPVCSLLTAKSASWSNKKVSASHLWKGVANKSEQANASLIAAAPDLLAALKEIVKNDPYNQSSAGIIARAAIAKATGGAA